MSHYRSPTSPPHNLFRDHSPQKSSPLRHTLSTLSNHSDTENTLIPSRHGTLSSTGSSEPSRGSYGGYDSANDPFVTRTSAKRERSESPVKKNATFAKWEQREQAEQAPHTAKASRTMD
ncbi:iqgap-related protein, partial [Friedmanniomyces endolithicus]